MERNSGFVVLNSVVPQVELVVPGAGDAVNSAVVSVRGSSASHVEWRIA